MEITYQLNESEFTYDFFKALKKSFKGKQKVELRIKIEEREHKVQKEIFEKMILDEETSEKYVFKDNAFEQFIQAVLNGEAVDIESSNSPQKYERGCFYKQFFKNR